MRLVCGLLVLALSACENDPYAHCGPAEGLVVNVLDGDTLELENGEKVRYILVDTPELSGGDCYAREALDANTELVLERTVQLRYDVACRDRHNRLLAYVTVGDVEVNRYLVEQGYACVYEFPPAGESRAEEFREYEFQAQVARRGVWSACEPVTCHRP